MLRALVSLAVLGAGVYISAHYAAPQVRAWRFRDAMNQTARLAGTQTVGELRGSLVQAARDLGVPLEPSRLALRCEEYGHCQIHASWDEAVRLRAWKIGEWVDTLHYTHEAEGPLQGRR